MADSADARTPNAREWLAAAAVSLLIAAALVQLAGLLPEPDSFQTRANLSFARKDSLIRALTKYHQWPPLYPTLLWVAAVAKVPALWVDAALLGCSCLLLWRLVRLACGPLPALAALGAFGVGYFNVANVSEHKSEPLGIALELGVMLALLSYRRSPDLRRLAAVGILLGAAGITRYHSLFWLLPGVLLTVWRQGPGHARQLHATALACIAAAPAAAWMAKEKVMTGFLSGMGRLHERRNHELTTFSKNLWFTMKTLAIDWFSPSGSASHALVNAPWRPSVAEVVLTAVGLVALAAAFVGVLRRRLKAPAATEDIEGLNGLFVGLYFVSLLAIWTMANNDPIYTRFLYPSYPLLCLAVALGWRAASGGASRLWFGIATGAYLIAQVSKYAALIRPALAQQS